jgi:hypothetical protein
MLATAALNKLAEARTKQKTTRWLATQDEVEAFGGAAGRVARRRVPQELLDSNENAADFIIMGEVVVTYGARTLLNLSPEEAAQAAQEYIEAQARPAPAPGPEEGPQAAAQAPPTAPAPRTVVGPTEDDLAPSSGYGAVAATPSPPSVISPGI